MKKYDIYFTCAMTGQPKKLRKGNIDFGLRLKNLSTELGYNIFDPEKVDAEEGFSEDEIFDRDREVVEQCKLLIALLDAPSCGAGGEITICHYFKIPVILISRNLDKLSPFITSNKQVKEEIPFIKITDVIEKLRTSIPTYMNGHE